MTGEDAAFQSSGIWLTNLIMIRRRSDDLKWHFPHSGCMEDWKIGETSFLFFITKSFAYNTLRQKAIFLVYFSRTSVVSCLHLMVQCVLILIIKCEIQIKRPTCVCINIQLFPHNLLEMLSILYSRKLPQPHTSVYS